MEKQSITFRILLFPVPFSNKRSNLIGCCDQLLTLTPWTWHLRGPEGAPLPHDRTRIFEMALGSWGPCHSFCTRRRSINLHLCNELWMKSPAYISMHVIDTYVSKGLIKYIYIIYISYMFVYCQDKQLNRKGLWNSTHKLSFQRLTSPFPCHCSIKSLHSMLQMYF